MLSSWGAFLRLIRSPTDHRSCSVLCSGCTWQQGSGAEYTGNRRSGTCCTCKTSTLAFRSGKNIEIGVCLLYFSWERKVEVSCDEESSLWMLLCWLVCPSCASQCAGTWHKHFLWKGCTQCAHRGNMVSSASLRCAGINTLFWKGSFHIFQMSSSLELCAFYYITFKFFKFGAWPQVFILCS